MSVRDQPHYTLPITTLADWIDSQPDVWWAVDGDNWLMSILCFPCPHDEIAPALRKIGKDVSVHDKTSGSTAHGEVIDGSQLNALADTNNNLRLREFLMSWVDSDEDWMLMEDEAMKAQSDSATASEAFGRMASGKEDQEPTTRGSIMSIRDKPHYTLPVAALADWIDSQPDVWWSVDGDNELMSLLHFPCPHDEIAPALRKIGKDVLVYDKTPGSTAHGEAISGSQLNALADTNNWRRRRTFLLCWVDSDEEWSLLESEAMVAN